MSAATSGDFALSMALPTSNDFGNPELPVTNTLPFLRATNAPVGTVTHHAMPS
jgi:hypothetical protein